MEDRVAIPIDVVKALRLLESFEHAELIISSSGEIIINQMEKFETEYSLSKVWFGGLQVVVEWRLDHDGIWVPKPIPRKWDWID